MIGHLAVLVIGLCLGALLQDSFDLLAKVDRVLQRFIAWRRG